MNAEKIRKAIEKTYINTCNIYSFKKVQEGSITKLAKVLDYENIKCALSQESLKTAENNQSHSKIDYDAKLFISPEIKLLAGSEIEIAGFGKTQAFKYVGEPFVYETHQEVLLKREEKA